MNILDCRNGKWNEPEKITFDCEILTDEFPNEWLPFTFDSNDPSEHVSNFKNGWLSENENQIAEITQSEFNQRQTEQKATIVRFERDRLLEESDVHVLPDRWATLSEEQKQAWSSYRQHLRDIPNQSGFPNEIDWGVKP